jgi:nucleotide-binding universal stress UspA family protein
VSASHHDAARQRQDAEHELAAVLEEAFGQELPDGLVSEVIEGTAERALVDRSAGADMVVLGSTSSPTAGGRSIGPVIRSCLSRAHCPVVIIGLERLAGDHDAVVGRNLVGA